MKRLCSIEGCGRKHRARGYCKAHYNRWHRTGNAGAAIVRGRRPPTCSVVGCERGHKAHGYCSVHYHRWRNHNHTELIKPIHGRAHTPEHRIWHGIIGRCERRGDSSFQWYGARGIKICPEWRKDFMTFYRDMGPRPDGHSIDRIDPDGDYEPSNCRWATPKHQRGNQRKPRR